MRVRCSPERTGRALRARWGRSARSRFGDEGGFTITESVTGLAILFIVILALVASITVAVRGILTGRQRSTALAVAEQTMEEIRAVDYERIGHVSTDATIASGCGSPATTEFALGAKTYQYPSGGEPIAYAISGNAVVGGLNAPVASHCTTGTLDGTDYTQWVYVTIVDSTPATEPHKRVTIVVEFHREQYDSATIENKAKISSLVFAGDTTDGPLIEVEVDVNAGGFSMSGSPGVDLDSLTATHAAAYATLRSQIWDALSGWADTASGRAEAPDIAADNPPCSVSGAVATCPAATRASTIGDDDPGTSGVNEHDGPATGSVGRGEITVDGNLTLEWEGGSSYSELSACYWSIGACGTPFALGAWDHDLPLARNRGIGPLDMESYANLDLGSLGTLPVTWVDYSDDPQADADIDQEPAGTPLGVSKHTVPEGRIVVPAMTLGQVTDPVGGVPVNLVTLGATTITGRAPVGQDEPLPASGGGPDVDAAPVTVSIAGVPIAGGITPGTGATLNPAPVTVLLPTLRLNVTVSAVAGTAVEDETRTGAGTGVVEESTATLLDALVFTVDIEIVVCGTGTTNLDCLSQTPYTIADVTLVVDYGDLEVTGTHAE